MTAFTQYCAAKTGLSFADYQSFDRFSIEEFQTFWRLFLSWSRIPYGGEPDPVCVGDSCEHACFFPNLHINYTECLLSGDPDGPALTACHRGRPDDRLSRGELRARAVRLACSLRELGVRPGDRVVAIARNNAEVIVAALAASAIGASFSSCAPDMGAFAILTRFSPLEPTVLLGNLRPEPWDAGAPVPARVAEVVAGLPSLQTLIALDEGGIPDGISLPVRLYADLTAGTGADPGFAWERFPFNHPLFVMFSSGTTGTPKCIVHSAGGTLLEHLKEHRLHCNLRAGDKLFFQTSCGWMMWNWQLSALACGVELVLYDGPIEGPETLWRLVSDERVTVFGTSATFLQFCEAAGFSPAEQCELASLRGVLSTGSILYPRQYDWVSGHVKTLPLQSISGGTDIIGCFVLGNPNLPVYRGEAQCRSLGLDVRALPPTEARDEKVGELVCANPFPSRPLGFYNDPDGRRFHDAYFSQNPGVWTHGDLIEATPQGGWILHGRSDGVINVRGIRVGPAEIYAALQGIDEITEAMAVEQHTPGHAGGTRLVLLVVLRKGAHLDGVLEKRIRAQLTARGFAALVPDIIAVVKGLPVTYSGKRSEAAARDAVNGRPARNRDALQNPGCLDQIASHPALHARSWPAEARPSIEEISRGAQLERELQRISEDVLRVSPIRWSDDLFDLGADSLTILDLLLAMRRFSGRADLSLDALLSTRTIDRFAALLRAGFAATGGKEAVRSGLQVQPVAAEDLGPICALLDEGFKAEGIPLSAWRRLFDYHWLGDKPGLGFMLASDRQIVGFVGTIYARRQIRDETHLTCNLAFWYVRPEFRAWAGALLEAATKDKDITYTALTPTRRSRDALAAL
ncbi:MAG: acetoacetate--CoA ligase, partial [Acetobacteraceae bacterium]|nr:acetoacetate--CoA ligase [Acetobacteraceae bacterium]